MGFKMIQKLHNSCCGKIRKLQLFDFSAGVDGKEVQHQKNGITVAANSVYTHTSLCG
jgi:hypothetical protein